MHHDWDVHQPPRNPCRTRSGTQSERNHLVKCTSTRNDVWWGWVTGVTWRLILEEHSIKETDNRPSVLVGS